MIQETMTGTERFNAAVALEPVDRTPVFPILVTSAPRLYGITQGEAWRDHDAAREALLWCYREFGYDYGSKPNYYYPMLPGKLLGAPVRNLIPGKQLPEDALYQIDERVLFEQSDYDRLISLGWNAFWDEHYATLGSKTLEQFSRMQEISNRLYVEDMAICEGEGMPIFLGVAVDSVLMAFSLGRTLTGFTRDLHRIPDKVEAAMQACCDDLIANAVEVCKRNGNHIVFVVLERGSGFYYRPEIFERFEFPFLQRYVDAFLSEGLMPWLHFDTDYGANLHHLKKLPRGSCVCDLDGTTDIFKAKEILGGHMCISGDVPAGILSIGTPGEVEDYCKRLIDEVGEGGGFLLTTGCECPMDVKPENLRAMVETGKGYRGRKGRVKTTGLVQGEPGDAPAVEVSGVLAMAVADLKYDEVMNLVESDLEGGRDPLQVLNDCRSGLEKVGDMYSAGEYFLAELIMSADLFKNVVARVEPLLSDGRSTADRGGVVIATPQGDIHDIGKDIVATLLKAAGFEVHDLGVDVAPASIVGTMEDTGARILAMSALITPTFGSMKATVELLKEGGLRGDSFVIIGGGPTTENVRDFVGADAWTLDPREGIRRCLSFAGA